MCSSRFGLNVSLPLRVAYVRSGSPFVRGPHRGSERGSPMHFRLANCIIAASWSECHPPNVLLKGLIAVVAGYGMTQGTTERWAAIC